MRFQYPYRAIPYFFDTIAYGDVKFTLNPRWYLAGRFGGRWRAKKLGLDQSNEVVLAFRPANGHLLKIGYQALRGNLRSGSRDNVFGIQYIVSLNTPVIAWE